LIYRIKTRWEEVEANKILKERSLQRKSFYIRNGAKLGTISAILTLHNLLWGEKVIINVSV
jgi:hypothetical protein